MSSDDDKPDAELVAFYHRLPREAPPPAAHETRVAAALRSRGLLTKPAYRSLPLLARIAAAIALFVSGFAVHALTSTPTTPLDPRYVLFVENGPTYRPASSPAEAKRRVGEYGDWARRLRAKGVAISGLKLKPGEKGDAVSGVFMVDVPDRSAAEAIAAGSPHWRYGGTIVVREVEKL